MNKKKILLNIFTAFMVLVMGIGLISPVMVSADTKSEYEQAQEKLDEINKEIESLANKKKQEQAKKNNAQTQINLVKTQIKTLNNDIKKQNERLAEKQREIEEKKLDIYNTDELFKERLKAMYIMRSGGTLSTILAVDSFSQLMTATDTLQRISVADTELLKDLDAEKKELEKAEEEIQTQLNTLVEKRGQLQNKQSELAGYMQTLDANLSATEAAEQAAKDTQKELYAEYLAAKNRFEAEFGESTGDFVGGEWLWPVPGYRTITSGFGNRVIFGRRDYHTGIDISGYAINGKPIVAANSGTVTKAVSGYANTSFSGPGYGNYVIIDHGGNTFSVYGHCSSVYVGVGDYVTQGQTIARVGTSGTSTGYHLHFEIRLNGGKLANAVNPLPLVSASRP